MRRERFEPIAEPTRRMSEAARADVEALRSSERLQRIFQADGAQGRRSGSATDAVARSPAEAKRSSGDRAAPWDARGFFSSRRTRVLVGLLPVYLAMAVLAVEGLRALREEPDRVAFVSADGSTRSATGAAPLVEPPSRPRAAVAAGTQAGPGRAGDARDGAGGAPPGGEELASLPTGPARSAMPKPRPPEPAAAQAEGPARSGKASGDLAKTIEGARPTTQPASPSQVAAARAEREPAGAEDHARAPTPTAAPVAEPERVAGVEPAGSVPDDAKQARPTVAAVEPSSSWGENADETVPQATWSGGEAAPVPLPTPRFARLSEVLAQRRASTDEQDEPRSRARSTSDEAQALSTASTRDPAIGGSAPPAESAPPRIVVHYQRGAGTAARRVASELRALGYARTELRPVPFAISRANVRYFHAQNRPVARAVNDLVEAAGGRSDLRDFTHYAPSPAVGTVEIWLPG